MACHNSISFTHVLWSCKRLDRLPDGLWMDNQRTAVDNRRLYSSELRHDACTPTVQCGAISTCIHMQMNTAPLRKITLPSTDSFLLPLANKSAKVANHVSCGCVRMPSGDDIHSLTISTRGIASYLVSRRPFWSPMSAGRHCGTDALICTSDAGVDDRASW